MLLLIIFLVNVSCKQIYKPVSLQTALKETVEGEYRIGIYKNNNEVIDAHKITHIIVIGSALKEDSDQFFQSGIARAQRYKELWPDHQIIFMSGPDVKGTDDEIIFQRYKIPVTKIVHQKFTAPLLLKEMKEFKKIASFDFYGHASPWAMIIGKSGAVFDPSAHYQELKALRAQLMPNAYATLNGCNTGFYIAPDLSRALAIPVSGSLTSSVFERIESDRFWYKEEDWSEQGEVFFNRFSYKKKLSCETGACTRMKSSRRNYSSFWGTFSQGGLSFDKFFCNYKNNQNGTCEKAMVFSLLSFPSVRPISADSSVEEFKEVVFDWLCSTGKNLEYYQKCVNGILESIDRGDHIYQSHPSNELNCDFYSCNASIVCKFKTSEEVPIPGSCDIETIPNNEPKNIATEYLSLMKGFDDIKLDQ